MPSNLNIRYYVCFIDDCTHFMRIYPMKHKSNVYDMFFAFQNLVENLHDHKIKFFISDDGKDVNDHGFYFG